MIFFKENFIDHKSCKDIINFYRKNKNNSYLHHKSYPLNVYDCEKNFSTEPIKKLKNIFEEIKIICKNYSDNTHSLSCYNYQITKWPIGSSMPWHCDLEHTTFSCILYLNDFYIGGRTLFENVDDIRMQRKGNLLIMKNSDTIEHSVEKIIFGTRYTLSLWFCNQNSEFYNNKVNEIMQNL